MKPNKIRDYLGRSVLAVGVLTLAACGGSDSTTTNNNDTSTVKLSGLVADGYLVGAKVCLDKSRNKRCDAGEPSAISTTGGVYELLDVTQSDAAAYPVIAEVVAGTIDEDNPGTPVGRPYTLTAPVGKHGFVSPITTMIQTRIDTSPSLTPAQAESAVKTEMGYPADSNVSLFNDYVAAAADATNPDADSYAHVHEVAKVTARVLEANQQLLEEAAVAAGLDLATVFDSLVNIIVQQVLLELSAIAADPVNYDTTTVDAAVTTSTTDITVAIEEQELQQSATAVSNLETLMKSGGGLNWAWGWTDSTNYELEYGNVTVNAANEFTETAKIYTTANPQWSTSSLNTDYEIVMGASDWVSTPPDAPRTVTFNNDGTWTLSHVAVSETLFPPTEVDVSSKVIADYVTDDVWRSLMDPAATFSAGAKIYQISSSWNQNYYHVRFWNDPAGCQGSGIAYVDATTNCNSVIVNNSFSAATTLDAAFSTNLTDTAWIWAWQVNTMNGQGAVKLIRASAADTSGAASYGYIDANTNNYVQLVASTWNKVTVNGVEMILLDLPLAVRQQVNDIDSDTEKMMLTVHDGYLRWGEYTSTAFVNTFNMYSATAMQDIVANVTLP